MCAGGSQVCTGHSGTLMPRPASRRDATTTWVGPAQPRATAGRQRRQVGGAGGGDEREDAQQHQRRAEHGVEDEPARRVATCRRVAGVAEPADEHPHRHEDDLEGHEEQDRVAGEERGERPELDQQQAAVERRAGADVRRVRAGVQHNRDAEDGGQDQQRCADAVDGEVPSHPERGHPGPVQDRPGHHGHDDEGGGQDRDGQGEGVDEPVARGTAGAAGDHQRGPRHRRQDQRGHEHGHHRLTPTRPTASTPQSTQTSPVDGRRVCRRSAPTPAQRVATAVPRT